MENSMPAIQWKLCLIVLLASGLSRVSVGAEEPPPATPVAKTEQPIKIDGVLDEPAWQTATPIRVNYVWGKVGQANPQPTMVVKYTWDDNYFYIGYETFDANLVALPTDQVQGPPKNQRSGASIADPKEKVDVTEFFISFGDERFFWELHHNAANQFNDIWIAVMDDAWPIAKQRIARFGIYFGDREIVDDDTEAGFTLETAARPKPKADGSPSTINDSSDTDTGYTAELRLPWLGLGAPFERETQVKAPPAVAGEPERTIHGPWKMEGQELRVLAVFQNGDLEDHYHHSSPTFPGSWFHKGATHYPRYRLVGPAK
jgi:cellulose/xylan binding protein with CBM9 domain